MPKAAFVILSDTESRADMGRVSNALIAAKEFKDAGDPVTVIFDGAGTRWALALANPEHPLHGLYETLDDGMGVCRFCAGAYDVLDGLDTDHVHPLDEHEGHPSFRSLVEQGYQVMTF